MPSPPASLAGGAPNQVSYVLHLWGLKTRPAFCYQHEGGGAGRFRALGWGVLGPHPRGVWDGPRLQSEGPG